MARDSGNKEVQPRAQSALLDSPIFELRSLQVDQTKGRLILSGTVSSFYHKQLAQEVVRAVCLECRNTSVNVVNSIRVAEGAL